jgi:hypothetical protein
VVVAVVPHIQVQQQAQEDQEVVVPVEITHIQVVQEQLTQVVALEVVEALWVQQEDRE